VRGVLAEADVLVNVSLTTPMRPEYLAVPHRLAIDTDPVFTQVSVARGSPITEMHTRLFTFGRPPLPGQRHEWVPTRQAIASRFWPVAPPPPDGAPFTTVTSWQAYPPLEWEGKEYGLKDRSVREHVELPQRTAVPLRVGLAGGIDSGEGARFLRGRGWQVEDALAPTRSTEAYRHYIAGSAGEIGFAKHAYVAARSGWFSDRTCCYLASGRPAVVQDTGWSEWLPAGEGVVGFTTTDEAAAALEEVNADLPRHCAAARKVAEEHFEATRVCQELLEAAL
ncbi:MAG: glycosyltransferase, partial [Actinomycetota bacterium]